MIYRNRYLKGVGRRFFSILLVCMIMGVRLIGTTVINAASSIAVRIITSDGQTEELAGKSLSAALHGAGLTGIDRLLVSDGSITSKDWEWLRNNRAAFAALTEFEISDRVQTADLPDAPVGSPAYPSIFPYQLQKVVIPQSVRIGSNAFDGCNELRIVDITNAYEIGESAFSQCHALQSVAFPKVTSIENAAFSGCDGLTYASLPSLCTIGDQAFYSCKQLKTLEFSQLVRVNTAAFESCTALTEIEIPNVTSLGSSVFRNCKSLKKVNIPEVIQIPEKTFMDCISLQTVHAPKAEDIMASAFYGASALTAISFPSAVAIKEKAFSNCSSLRAIDLPRASAISKQAFKNCTALSYAKLSSVTVISEEGFMGCTALTSIHAPLAERIRDAAFMSCSSLTDIVLPGAVYIDNQVFSDCNSLTEIRLERAERIGSRAFENCTNLKTAEFPQADRIGEFAFRNCLKLDTLLLPDGLTPAADSIMLTINMTDGTREALQGDTLQAALQTVSLTEISRLIVTDGRISTADWEWMRSQHDTLQNLKEFEIQRNLYEIADLPSANDYTAIFPDCIEKVTIPQSVIIGDYAFERCAALTEIEAPEAYRIGKHAFAKCSSLKTASFPEADFVDEYAFQLCGQLQNLHFPKAESIGSSAFTDCRALQRVQFPNVYGIGDSAFKGCIALEELQFPSAVRIGSRAFFGCSSLQEVSFPNVRAVESSAYYGCTGLKSIILPAVESIDDNAFWFSQSLSRLLLPPQPPVMGENIFIGASDQREVRICDETGTVLNGVEIQQYLQSYLQKDTVWYGCNLYTGMFSVALSIQKDHKPWEDSGKTFAWRGDTGTFSSTERLPNGSFQLYETSTGSDLATGITVKVDEQDTTAAVDYYTISFFNKTQLLKEMEQIVLKGTMAEIPSDPKEPGAVFTCWKAKQTDREAYDFQQPVNEAMSLYADWKTVFKVKIRSYKDGAVWKDCGKQYILKDNAGAYVDIDAVKNGDYTICEKTEQGIHNTGATISIYGTDKTVDIEYYTVTVRDTASSHIWNEEIVRKGKCASKPAVPERDGFVFAYWAEDAQGKQSYDFTKPVEKQTTLYAIWKKCSASSEQPSFAGNHPANNPTHKDSHQKTTPLRPKTSDATSTGSFLFLCICSAGMILYRKRGK